MLLFRKNAEDIENKEDLKNGMACIRHEIKRENFADPVDFLISGLATGRRKD